MQHSKSEILSKMKDARSWKEVGVPVKEVYEAFSGEYGDSDSDSDSDSVSEVDIEEMESEIERLKSENMKLMEANKKLRQGARR